MAEYIERKALLELYESTDELNIDGFSIPVEVVRQNIKDMPAVVGLCVVLCEECKYRYYCPRKLKRFRGFDGNGKRLYKTVTVYSCEYGEMDNVYIRLKGVRS